MPTFELLDVPQFTALRTRRVLAIASGGGHWMELCRLLPAFDGFDVAFVSVHANYSKQVTGHRYYVVKDVSRQNALGVIVLLPQLLRVLVRERPDVVVTTGSAPALLALALSKLLLRSKTMWIDSLANVERLSTSGSFARYVADVWLTQWPSLEGRNGPAYWGRVL